MTTVDKTLPLWSTHVRAVKLINLSNLLISRAGDVHPNPGPLLNIAQLNVRNLNFKAESNHHDWWFRDNIPKVLVDALNLLSNLGHETKLPD